MDSLLLQVIIPFSLAALVVILISYIAEKYGTKIGGILGTLPSTIVVAFLFIAINKGADFASEAAVIVPAQMCINIFLLYLIAIFTPKYRYLGLIPAISIWLIFTIILIIFDINDFFIYLLSYGATLIVILLVLEYFKIAPSIEKVKVNYTTKKLLFRGVLAGIVIATAVSLSNFSPVFSGVFSIFPAIFLSTMIIFLKEHGHEFTGGMAKSMIYGSQTVIVYITAVYFLYPTYGIVWGTILSFGVSLIVVVLLLLFRKKIS